MIKILNKKVRTYTIPHLNCLESFQKERQLLCKSGMITVLAYKILTTGFRPLTSVQNVALYWCWASFFTKTKTGCPCAFFFALRKHLCFKFLPPLLKSKLTCCSAIHQKAMTYSWAIPCNGTYKVEL